MSKQYRPWTPEQTFLLPPSPREWLPEGHLAFFVLEVVRELDLGAIETALRPRIPRGERPYAPRRMTGRILRTLTLEKTPSLVRTIAATRSPRSFSTARRDSSAFAS